MPHGELHAFLTALHRTTSHLSAGLHDLQSTLASDEDEYSPREHVAFSASTFENAARVLDDTAAAMRRSCPNSEPPPASDSSNVLPPVASIEPNHDDTTHLQPQGLVD